MGREAERQNAHNPSLLLAACAQACVPRRTRDAADESKTQLQRQTQSDEQGQHEVKYKLLTHRGLRSDWFRIFSLRLLPLDRLFDDLLDPATCRITISCWSTLILSRCAEVVVNLGNYRKRGEGECTARLKGGKSEGASIRSLAVNGSRVCPPSFRNPSSRRLHVQPQALHIIIPEDPLGACNPIRAPFSGGPMNVADSSVYHYPSNC